MAPDPGAPARYVRLAIPDRPSDEATGLTDDLPVFSTCVLRAAATPFAYGASFLIPAAAITFA